MNSLKLCFLSLIGYSLLLVSCTQNQGIPLETGSLFSDYMVIQQQDTVPVWGKYTPGAKVSVSASWGANTSGQADASGDWMLALPSPEAGGPFTIRIETSDSIIQIQNVLAGEVWLASGQSNMEMPLKGWPPRDPILNADEEIASADFPDIRMFTVTKNYSTDPQYEVQGSWALCIPANAPDFSATAYFFARKLYQELQIPIGIIHSSWGGTVAEAWASEDHLKELGDFDDQLANINDPERLAKISNWFDKWPSHPIPQSEEDWASIPFDNKISANTFNDQDWAKRQIPGRVDNFGNTSVDGAIWIRKTVVINDISEDYTLSIGAIDDRDVTFVNGQLVGKTMGAGQYNRPRSYQIPKETLRTGENMISIRVIDTGGPGSVQAPLQLATKSGRTIDLSGEWTIKPTAEIYERELYLYSGDKNELDERPEVYQITQNSPTALYNAMIHPLVPYTIKGAIWYQGESNVGRAEQYTRLFPKMINSWRSKWEANFPFYFVQIAPFGYNGNTDPANDLSQRLRDAQRKTLSLANTGMAVTLDIGNNTNIHPANKQDVGLRLALWALANDYNQSVIPSGPLYKKHDVVNQTIQISFDYAGERLMEKEGGLTGFEIAGEDGIFYPGNARIAEDQVHVFSNNVPDPKHVRYAWQDKATASLFNSEGLPASSFITE